MPVTQVLIGDHIWLDTGTADGVYQSTDVNLSNVVVTAMDNEGRVYSATTDTDGLYVIYVPANAIYTLTYAIPAGMQPTNGGVTDTSVSTNESNHTNGLIVSVSTQSNFNIDFAFKQVSTAIELAYFDAQPVSAVKCGHEADCVRVVWQVIAERDTAGYALWRTRVADGAIPVQSAAALITPQMIQATGAGSNYEWLDRATVPDTTYAYWLSEMNVNGNFTEYGPVVIRVDGVVSDETSPLPPVKPVQKRIHMIAE